MNSLVITGDPTFLKPLYTRSNSQETIVNEIQFDDFPTELIIMIAMASGFHACLTLRKTNKRLRQILNEKRNWAEFTRKSPDVIETKVTIETRMHQFDQIIFAEWPLNGQMVPCIVHRTFLEQYSFLGGISLIRSPNGRVKAEFFDNRETLECYQLDQTPGHSCPECKHYDNQTILKTEFVHKTLAKDEELSFQFKNIQVSVQEIQGVFGYSNDVPSITTKINKINGKLLNRFELGLYMKYIL